MENTPRKAVLIKKVRPLVENYDKVFTTRPNHPITDEYVTVKESFYRKCTHNIALFTTPDERASFGLVAYSYVNSQPVKRSEIQPAIAIMKDLAFDFDYYQKLDEK